MLQNNILINLQLQIHEKLFKSLSKNILFPLVIQQFQHT
jgi:hypothetical protein